MEKGKRIVWYIIVLLYLSLSVFAETDDTKTQQNYQWSFDTLQLSLSLDFTPTDYQYYQNLSRNRNYGVFAAHPGDDQLINTIAERLNDVIDANHMEEKDIPSLVSSFINSMEYVKDHQSKGLDDYTQFPYETLYEQKGDCEDFAILLAAILDEMGYKTALLQYSGHMAVGIDDPHQTGYHYKQAGISYYYMEATNPNWRIGRLPNGFEKATVMIIPVKSGADVDVAYSGKFTSDHKNFYLKLNLDLSNNGTEKAKDVKVKVRLEPYGKSTSTEKVLEDIQLGAEEQLKLNLDELTTAFSAAYRVRISVSGENFDPIEKISPWQKY